MIEPFAIEVIFVCGAPCSGKTTFVKKHRSKGDLIVDVDALFVALGLGKAYDNDKRLSPFVMEARDAVIRRLCKSSEVSRAWVTSCAPTTAERELWRSRNAKVIQLQTTPEQCLEYLNNDTMRDDKERHRGLIREYFRVLEQKV